jgi:hypothetical protein
MSAEDSHTLVNDGYVGGSLNRGASSVHTPKYAGNLSRISAVAAGLAVALVAASSLAVTPAQAEPGQQDFWRESFDHPMLDFVDPFHHDSHLLSRVYSVSHEGGESFLHALHDEETGGRTPAMHYGHAFQTNPPPLDRVKALRWRWRVLRHPDVTTDPWADVAASVYVIIKTPTMFHGGKGFKFGWLAKPGPDDELQHGILELPLRHDPAGPEWRSESVDLCALFRRSFGPCEGEHVLYVGVVTDADNTHSIAEGDYDDFELVEQP